MAAIDLQANCADCAALCCVLLPFDASAAFAFDKPALLPCVHLSRHRCTVHDRLSRLGFSGCERFNCFGAGQRVVQQVFGGKSWQDDPDLLAPMEAAFRTMRLLHESVAMLDAADALDLTTADKAERLRLLETLDAARVWTEAGLADFAAGPLLSEVRHYLASLRGRLMPPHP